MLPVGLSTYGFNVVMGYSRREAAPADCPPWTIDDFIRAAADWGLSSVELPTRLYEGNPAAVAQSKRLIAEHGLRCVADTGLAQTETIATAAPIAAALGASVLRVVLSNILCGDRARLNGGWRAYLEGMAEQLRAARPIAEQHGLIIAVENHQDVDSQELAWLCDYVGADRCGVCLDIANPLAVAEDIAAFTRRVGPYIRNVHLKDYKIYASPEGYRLARCALGQGVLDWPRLFAVLDEVAPGCPKHIELGAVQARHVQFLEDKFWPDYLPRPVTSLLPVLRLREAAGRPTGEDWRTPHEREEERERCRQFELDEMEESIRYLRSWLPEATRA